MELELAPLDRRPQLLDQLDPVGRAVEILLVDGELLALDLGPVHREVGAPDEIDRVQRIVREERDADTRPDLDAYGVERERLLDTGVQAPGDGGGIVGVAIQQRQRELVAPQTDDQVGLAQRAF